MSEMIKAVYENGVFLPLQPPRIEEHQRVHLLILPEEPTVLAASQREALTELAGIGESGLSDISASHDQICDDVCSPLGRVDAGRLES
jgi:predicted DNA-binding antitoxin AbrB/MazE fold protein